MKLEVTVHFHYRSNELIKEGKVINLGIGQPDFPTPKNIVESVIKALEDEASGILSNGFRAREAIASDFLKEIM